MAPLWPGGGGGGGIDLAAEPSQWGVCAKKTCEYNATGKDAPELARYYLETWPNDNRSPEPIHPPLTMAFVLATIVATLWGGLQTVVAVAKVAITFGTVDYIKYMTNWSWSWQTVFFDLVAIASWMVLIKEYRARKHHRAPTPDVFLRFVLENFFFPTIMLVFGVFFGLRVVLWYAPELLSENFEAYGEGLVYDANFFIHDLPLIPLVVYMLFAFQVVRHILRRSPTGIGVILVKGCLFMLLYTSAYCAFFSPTYVYSMREYINTAAACVIFGAFGVGMAVVVMLAMSPYADMAVPHPVLHKKSLEYNV